MMLLRSHYIQRDMPIPQGWEEERLIKRNSNGQCLNLADRADHLSRTTLTMRSHYIDRSTVYHIWEQLYMTQTLHLAIEDALY